MAASFLRLKVDKVRPTQAKNVAEVKANFSERMLDSERLPPLCKKNYVHLRFIGNIIWIRTWCAEKLMRKAALSRRARIILPLLGTLCPIEFKTKVRNLKWIRRTWDLNLPNQSLNHTPASWFFWSLYSANKKDLLTFIIVMDPCAGLLKKSRDPMS